MADTVEAISYKTDVKSRARDKVSERRDEVVDKVTGLKDRVVGTAQDAADSVQGHTQDALGSVQEHTPDRDQVRRGARKTASLAQENPLGLALGSAALGFLAGLVVPVSRKEHETIGPVADQVRDQARSVGQEALERGREVARQAGESAADTAREVGREHGEALAGSARDSAREAGESAREQARS
jgi:ElaB/YqjD/DUF883 family membrane-anchored ribosome-binding protein